jgi:hypothetical protein
MTFLDYEANRFTKRKPRLARGNTGAIPAVPEAPAGSNSSGQKTTKPRHAMRFADSAASGAAKIGSGTKKRPAPLERLGERAN